MPERRADASGDAPARRKRRSWARRKHLGLKTVGAAVAVLVVGLVVVVLTWDSGRPSFRDQVAAATVSGSTVPTTTTTTTPAPTADASTTPAPTATGSTPGGNPGPSVIRGSITTVGDSRWTVAATNGLDYTVVVASTTVLPNRRTFSSFGVGDTVTVRGTLDQGTITAQRVTLPAAATSSPS